MPMWLMGEYSAMRSPGRSCDRLTLLPIRACACDECGRPDMPACSKDHFTSPEQSNVFGPSLPHTYAEPCLLSAARVASMAAPLPTRLTGNSVLPPDVYAS